MDNNLASLPPETLHLILEVKREERRKAEEERRKAEEDRRRVEAELELRRLEIHGSSFDGSPSTAASPRPQFASPSTGAGLSPQPSSHSVGGGRRSATPTSRSPTPEYGAGGPLSPTSAGPPVDSDGAMLISNAVLFDMPGECFALEFSVLWKVGARAAIAAAFVERGLWGRIQRVSPIEVACVAVAEVPDGQARLIDFVNWLRNFARWDAACTGPLPPDAGRKAVMIGTCLLVDANDGITLTSDPRLVGLLGTRLAVRTAGAPSPRAFGPAAGAAPSPAPASAHAAAPAATSAPAARQQRRQSPSPSPPPARPPASSARGGGDAAYASDASADPRGIPAASENEPPDSDSPSLGSDAYRRRYGRGRP